MAMVGKCCLCPRHCGVNRLAGESGECHITSHVIVSSFGSHFGEESPLVGRHGSGTIFFAYCNLHCIFCQNYTISKQEFEEAINLAHQQGLYRLDKHQFLSPLRFVLR